MAIESVSEQALQQRDVCMIGLGPVGLVSGLCFARQGFAVVGVDVDAKRMAALHNAEMPFLERGAAALLRESCASGAFCVDDDAHAAIASAKVIMLAVGTPTVEGSGPDLSYLCAAAETIGEALAQKAARGVACLDGEAPVVVVRSTVPPGTMRNLLAPIIAKASGLSCGEGFHIASNPEFLREGEAIDDFFNASRVVIGVDNPIAGLAISRLYRDVPSEHMVVKVETAELAKYVDNSWHAVKVAFANEVGRVAAACGGDVDETTRVFLKDDHLNVSAHYLRPGTAFGGSCLPKDLRGMVHLAGTYGIDLPLTSAVLPSNNAHIESWLDTIVASGARNVGLVGVAFKPDIDDLRESPYLVLASLLEQRGIDVHAFDPAYASGETLDLPNNDNALSMRSKEELLAAAELMVLCHDTEALRTWAEQQVQEKGIELLNTSRMQTPVHHGNIASEQEAAALDYVLEVSGVPLQARENEIA